MKGLCMVVMAALAPLLAVAPNTPAQSVLNGKQQTVKCAAQAEPVKVVVSLPDSTVAVQCQENSQFDPPVAENAEKQNVYVDAECRTEKPLNQICPNVSIAASNNAKTSSGTTAATLTILTLPQDKQQVCFVQCKPQSDLQRDKQTCVVQLTVNQATQGAEGQAGGVHICEKPAGSITVRVPDKNSSVQFRCAERFVLYPTKPEKVFKDDCKPEKVFKDDCMTEENLKDMTRTQAPAATSARGASGDEATAGSPITFTLTADKKPERKRLCYLCAEQEAGDTAAKPAEKYCAIYVESSALTKSHHVVPWALVPPCIFALLRIP